MYYVLVCAVPRSAEMNETIITILNYTNNTINYHFNTSVRNFLFTSKNWCFAGYIRMYW